MKNENRLMANFNASKVRNIIFEMTNACNMRCIYCFEEDARQINDIGIISWEIIQRTLDAVLIHKNEQYMVTFFGGEPLLCKELVFQAIDYSKKIARMLKSYVSFNMVTNAVCLDCETTDRLNEEDVYLFISFDGDRDSQDKYRRMGNGDSSYGLVLKNLKGLVQSRKCVYCKDNMAVRMTITKDGIEHLPERYRFLRQLGCPKITFALVSADKHRSYAISEEDFPKLRTAYQELAELFIEEVQEGHLRNRFYQSLVKKISDGSHCSYFCDCGNRYLGVGHDGNLYPCEGFFGLKDFVVGNILTCTSEKTNSFIECVEDNASCRNCWARYLCGGGCYHESLMRTGNINEKDPIVCETYRIAAETALYIYGELKQRDLLSKFMTLAEEMIPDHAIPVFRDTSCKKQGALLYSVTPSASYIIELDGISEDVISLCDGTHSIGQIAERLLEIYDCKVENLYKDVCQLLNDLYERNVIYFINSL